MYYLIRIGIDYLRELLVSGILAVSTEDLYNTLSARYALWLRLAVKLKRTQLVVVSLGEEHQGFHVAGKEADVLRIHLVSGHFCNNPHCAQDSIAV